MPPHIPYAALLILTIWLFGAIPDAPGHTLVDLGKVDFAECNLVVLSFLIDTSRCMVVLYFYVLVLSAHHNSEQPLIQ